MHLFDCAGAWYNTGWKCKTERVRMMKQALIRILKETDALILKTRSFAIEEKEGHANYVTTVDEGVEALLEKQLLQLLPGSKLIGEEQDNEPLGDGYTWIIDPLDGTTNFIHDYRFSAVSIALLKDRQPVIGAIYQPYAQELFYAEKGKGAELNGRPIHVSAQDFGHALVGFGTSPYHAEQAKKTLEIALGYLQNAADIRRCGSAALDLAYVACGRQDVFFELNLKPWDVAAGALLITEADGVFEMPFCDGTDFSQPNAIFASNQTAYKEARELFDSYFE